MLPTTAGDSGACAFQAERRGSYLQDVVSRKVRIIQGEPIGKKGDVLIRKLLLDLIQICKIVAFLAGRLQMHCKSLGFNTSLEIPGRDTTLPNTPYIIRCAQESQMCPTEVSCQEGYG